MLCFTGLSWAASITLRTAENRKTRDEKSGFLARMRRRLYEILINVNSGEIFHLSIRHVTLNTGVTCHSDEHQLPDRTELIH